MPNKKGKENEENKREKGGRSERRKMGRKERKKGKRKGTEKGADAVTLNKNLKLHFPMGLSTYNFNGFGCTMHIILLLMQELRN